MSVDIKGPWSRAEIDQYLGSSRIPIRLACIGSDEFPRVVSVWFQYQQGNIYCASHRNSQLVALLRERNRVGFEVATNDPPYFGVRGQGIARLSSEGGGQTLESLLQRYLGGTDSSLASWLLSRREEEVLITIDPLRLFSWDYRGRMAD